MYSMNVRWNGIFYYSMIALFVSACLNQLIGYWNLKPNVNVEIEMNEIQKFYHLKNKRYEIDWDSLDVSFTLYMLITLTKGLWN